MRSSHVSLLLKLLRPHAKTDMSVAAQPAIAYEYIWFGAQPVAQLDLATSTTHWTATDHLGTPIAQTNATATIDWRPEYEPYGQVHTYRTGPTRHQPLVQSAAGAS